MVFDTLFVTCTHYQVPSQRKSIPSAYDHLLETHFSWIIGVPHQKSEWSTMKLLGDSPQIWEDELIYH
jgi:hypothetical protein